MEADALALELAKIDPALKQQLAAAGVPELIQAHLAKNAFCSIARFQVLGFTDEGVMESCKRLGLDKIKEEMEQFSQATSVVLAWQACKSIQAASTTTMAGKKALGINTVIKPA